MHPHQEYRQDKVEKRRVHDLTKGYAAGGAVGIDDAAEDERMYRKTDKPEAKRSYEGRMDGGAVKARADHRARGGRTKHKGRGHTTVNVVVPHAGGGAPVPPPAAVAPPPVHPPMVAPPMGPPPMAAPAGPSPGMAGPPRPMMPPPGPGGMPMREHGGRTYARGGGVDGPAWKEGLRNMTQPWNLPGKNTKDKMGRGKPVTYATGGKVEASNAVSAPHLPGGSGGGEARLAKARMARRGYAKPAKG